MEPLEKFSLKWNNYQSHLSSRFQNLQQLEEFTDVTLYCDDKKIKAHKVILAACSPYFQDVFEDLSHQQSAIIFRDVKYNDLAAILRFIYTGEVEITQEMLPSFIKTAHLLKVNVLTNMKFNEQMEATLGTNNKKPIPAEAEQQEELKKIPTPAIPEVDGPENTPLSYCEADIEQVQDSKRIKTEPIDESSNNSTHESDNLTAAELIDGTEDVLEIDRDMASWLPASIFSADDMQDTKPVMENFTTNSNSTGKRYQCKICGKGFNTYDRMRVHIDVHEGLTRCTVCGQTLSRKDSLRRHMKIKHTGMAI